MMKNIALSRPATSAIAAFLVLSTPAAFAQEAPTITMAPPIAEPTAPTPQTPPTVAAPTTPAPVAAPQAAQTPEPTPVIRVPLDVAPVETAPEPRATQRAEAPALVRAPRAAERSRPAAEAPVATAAAASAAPETAPTTELAPMAAPMAVPAEPVVEAAPLPAETAANSGGEFPWQIAGGAAALLIVGGAGLAFARRRHRTTDAVVYDEVVQDAPVQRFDAVAARAPVATQTQQWVTPAYTPREPAAAPRTTPAFAAAPSGSMGRHEAMAMAGPTPENPFATLNKRLKRARFLDRQERIAYDETLGAQKDVSRKPVSAWEIAQRSAPVTQEQEVRRPEPARVRTSTSFRPGYSNS